MRPWASRKPASPSALIWLQRLLAPACAESHARLTGRRHCAALPQMGPPSVHPPTPPPSVHPPIRPPTPPPPVCYRPPALMPPAAPPPAVSCTGGWGVHSQPALVCYTSPPVLPPPIPPPPPTPTLPPPTGTQTRRQPCPHRYIRVESMPTLPYLMAAPRVPWLFLPSLPVPLLLMMRARRIARGTHTPPHAPPPMGGCSPDAPQGGGSSVGRAGAGASPWIPGGGGYTGYRGGGGHPEYLGWGCPHRYRRGGAPGCDQFRIDLASSSFGRCVCGRSKTEHSPSALLGGWRRGSSRKIAELSRRLEAEAQPALAEQYAPRVLVSASPPPLERGGEASPERRMGGAANPVPTDQGVATPAPNTAGPPAGGGALGLARLFVGWGRGGATAASAGVGDAGGRQEGGGDRRGQAGGGAGEGVRAACAPGALLAQPSIESAPTPLSAPTALAAHATEVPTCAATRSASANGAQDGAPCNPGDAPPVRGGAGAMAGVVGALVGGAGAEGGCGASVAIP